MKMKILFALILATVVSSSVSYASGKMLETDVLVVGGGPSGVPAAIQAARAGCSTVLVEAGSQLGGSMTTAGVSFPGLFHAWGRQIISGIGWDLVCRTIETGGGSLPDFTKPYGNNHPAHQILLNAYVYSALAEEECLRSGVSIRYYEFPVSVRHFRNGWIVDIVGKGGTKERIRCNQLIDATGNASVAGMAGLERIREEDIQPGSLVFEFGGFDPSIIDYEELDHFLNAAKEDGRILPADCYSSAYALMNHHGIAVSHVTGADSSTSETHTLANINGRTSLLRLLRVLKSFHGLENLTINYMAGETGVRESWRIKGLYQITVDDYLDGRTFEDAVAYSFYPIDLHDAEGVEPRQLHEGNVPTVPLRALIPSKGSNILVAGRCLSSDRLANSALRVQATCMAVGQAAGAAAAIACKRKCQPADIPFEELKALLRENGAIVP